MILRHRKLLPKGVLVTEDLPEEWVHRRKILKPVFNVARRDDKLKQDTHLTKDQLTISGRTFTVENINEAQSLLDLKSTCQKGDQETLLFLGSHSPYSNLFPCSFTINNVKYNCAEQYIQSEKASLFDDNKTMAKILNEENPYVIKKLGSKVCRFSIDQWRQISKRVAHTAVLAKFNQNPDDEKFVAFQWESADR